eukprot:7245610-Prymnesium_polylepis.1
MSQTCVHVHDHVMCPVSGRPGLLGLRPAATPEPGRLLVARTVHTVCPTQRTRWPGSSYRPSGDLSCAAACAPGDHGCLYDHGSRGAASGCGCDGSLDEWRDSVKASNASRRSAKAAR